MSTSNEIVQVEDEDQVRQQGGTPPHHTPTATPQRSRENSLERFANRNAGKQIDEPINEQDDLK